MFFFLDIEFQKSYCINLRLLLLNWVKFYHLKIESFFEKILSNFFLEFFIQKFYFWILFEDQYNVDQCCKSKGLKVFFISDQLKIKQWNFQIWCLVFESFRKLYNFFFQVLDREFKHKNFKECFYLFQINSKNFPNWIKQMTLVSHHHHFDQQFSQKLHVWKNYEKKFTHLH